MSAAALKVVELPTNDIRDIPSALRLLADQIQAGDFGDALNFAWVIDCGDSRIELGLLGKAPEPASLGYFLFGLAQRRLQDGGLGQ